MNQVTSDNKKKANSAYQELIQTRQSIILSTVDEFGNPHASYAPFAMDADKNIYILGSELALHTNHLLKNKKISVLFIEDEVTTEQIFGRRRLDFACQVVEIQRDDEAWNYGVECLQQRFGDTVTMIASMLDFHLFKLVLEKGRFVMGFGGIYEVTQPNLDQLIPLKMKKSGGS